MSNLREMVAFAISHGDLTQDANEETCADIIAALARADPMGAALWRVHGTMDPASFIAARQLLVRRLLSEFAQQGFYVPAVAQQAMEEWFACQCRTCEGRKFVVDENAVRSTCPDCHGTGRGRASDSERMLKLHIRPGPYSQLTQVFDRAHVLLTAADARVERQIAYQLERRKPKKK